jgi:8-oxo-dGTP diphosphatase
MSMAGFCWRSAPRASAWRVFGSFPVVRELKEELGVDITESCLAPLTFASHAYEDFHLLMPLYVCRVWKGTPRSLEGQELKWVRPVAMAALPLLPADRPLVALLRDFL